MNPGIGSKKFSLLLQAGFFPMHFAWGFADLSRSLSLSDKKQKQTQILMKSDKFQPKPGKIHINRRGQHCRKRLEMFPTRPGAVDGLLGEVGEVQQGCSEKVGR